MLALYELAGNYRALSDKLHDAEFDPQTILDTLEAESGDLVTKGTNIGKFYRNLLATADQIKQAEAQMAARRKSIEKHAESLRTYLHSNMERAGITKIESPWFVISIKQNPASVQIDDESLIPDDYLKEVPATFAPDKKLMKSAMDEGYQIPGAQLVRGTRLEIK